MNDHTRDAIVRINAYGFLACIALLLVSSFTFGKGFGFWLLASLMPAYSIYYAVMYWQLCKNYSDEVKRLSAFGSIGRGTLAGAIYYVSLFLIIVFGCIVFSLLMNGV